MENEEKSIADGLRELADWYEEHSNIGLPRVVIDTPLTLDPGALVVHIGLVAKALGNCRKRVDEYSVVVSRDFGPVPVFMSVSRSEVCKKVVTWKCPESLLAAIGPDAMKAFKEA